MKKYTKQTLIFLLIFAIAMSTVILTPKDASAAIKSKTKSATLTVTDTKISGFKTIEGTVKVGKYVVAYGTDKKNENVYSYSTDGRKFIKAKNLGLSGKVSYQISGKNLYVISGSNPLNSYYKCVTNPAKLEKTTANKINISLPAGFTPSYAYLEEWGFSENKSGKYYTYASFYDSDYYLYSIVLSPSKAVVVNVNDKVKSLLHTDNFYIYDYMNISYNSNTYHAVTDVYDAKSGKYRFLYTKNGSSFQLCKAVPGSDKAYHDADWLGGKLIAYNSTKMNSDRTKHGVYYIYNPSSNKWERKTTGKYTSSTGFIYGSGATFSSYYYNWNSDKEYITCNEVTDKYTRTLISSDGKKWSALPKLYLSSPKYRLNNIEYSKTAFGTFAVENYSTSEENYRKQYVVISKLVDGKWKKLEGIKIKESNSTFYSDFLYHKIPTAIYNNKKTTVGYNLKTGESYTLPFNYDNNILLDGNSMTFYSGNKLYRSSDGFKTITKINLKAKEKTLKSKITATGIHAFSKDRVYAYIICGNKMYYTTTKKILKC